MKKLILIVIMIFAVQACVFADELIDKSGNVTRCKVISVSDGLIYYSVSGSTFSIQREYNDPVFSDYVDVVTKFGRHPEVTRYQGRLVFKDHMEVKIRRNGSDMDIPWYRIRNIGVYYAN